MKISLITVVYNRAATIERTILSVVEQTYPHIEYIVVDGASADGTLNIIHQYRDQIDQFVSEKDNGVYDAINKGIRLATGDIIGVLHADDCFAHPDVIKNVVQQFLQHPFVECVFGDVCFVRPENPNEIIRYVSSSIFSLKRFQYGIMPAHPTFYCYKKFFDIHGLYRTDLDIASDFDLLLRFLKIHRLTFHYIPELMIHMNTGGKSTSGLSSTLKINQEIRKVLKEHGIRSSYLHLYSRYFLKIREFF
jgi:glycosyltransferase involved in cell wall biosynthesis